MFAWAVILIKLGNPGCLFVTKS